MIDLVILSSIYALAFLIKETDGPFGIMATIRNYLFSNKYVGVFFFKLLDCYFCTGFWCGIFIYLLTQPFQINMLIVWALAGGFISMLGDKVMSR